MHEQLSVVDLAWQAGLFEGEGYIGIGFGPRNRPMGFLQASISNTDRQLLSPFHNAWGGYFRARRTPIGNRKPSYQWTLVALKAAAFLQSIAPYVRCDRMKSRIDVALEFQRAKSLGRPSDSRSGEYLEIQRICHDRLRVLNHRGLPSS